MYIHILYIYNICNARFYIYAEAFIQKQPLADFLKNRCS